MSLPSVHCLPQMLHKYLSIVVFPFCIDRKMTHTANVFVCPRIRERKIGGGFFRFSHFPYKKAGEKRVVNKSCDCESSVSVYGFFLTNILENMEKTFNFAFNKHLQLILLNVTIAVSCTTLFCAVLSSDMVGVSQVSLKLLILVTCMLF